jgi:hypothetical protein
VAALIILSGTDIAGHSPLQVAGLRVAQIGIGVLVALAIAMLSARYRAAQRLHAGCAELLSQVAQQVRQAAAAAEDGGQESAGAVTRAALGRLALLAASADHESRFFRRTSQVPALQHHQRIAGLMRRIVQDTAMLSRVLRVPTGGGQSTLAQQVAVQAAAALSAVAGAMTGSHPRQGSAIRCALGELRRLALTEVLGADEAGLMLAAPVRLLLADLQRLSHVVEVATAASSD